MATQHWGLSGNLLPSMAGPASRGRRFPGFGWTFGKSNLHTTSVPQKNIKHRKNVRSWRAPCILFDSCLGWFCHHFTVRIRNPRKRIFCDKYRTGALYSPVKVSHFGINFPQTNHAFPKRPLGHHLLHHIWVLFAKRRFLDPLLSGKFASKIDHVVPKWHHNLIKHWPFGRPASKDPSGAFQGLIFDYSWSILGLLGGASPLTRVWFCFGLVGSLIFWWSPYNNAASTHFKVQWRSRDWIERSARFSARWVLVYIYIYIYIYIKNL